MDRAAYLTYMTNSVLPQLLLWSLQILPAFLGVAMLIDFSMWGASDLTPDI